ncbi:hypothetical protein VTL71DRAFT_7266 [Oculimacula yallundae]|uniref:Uncharacterized protein n=1 Tax=Oculimacula yallundae TaxID=86028 RepID=A0ABR4BW74_9HELO
MAAAQFLGTIGGDEFFNKSVSLLTIKGPPGLSKTTGYKGRTSSKSHTSKTTPRSESSRCHTSTRSTSPRCFPSLQRPMHKPSSGDLIHRRTRSSQNVSEIHVWKRTAMVRIGKLASIGHEHNPSGNHDLENGCSLTNCSVYWGNKKMLKFALDVFLHKDCREVAGSEDIRNLIGEKDDLSLQVAKQLGAQGHSSPERPPWNIRNVQKYLLFIALSVSREGANDNSKSSLRSRASGAFLSERSHPSAYLGLETLDALVLRPLNTHTVIPVSKFSALTITSKHVTKYTTMTLHKTVKLDLTASAQASKDRGSASKDLADEELSMNTDSDRDSDDEADYDGEGNRIPRFEEDMAKNPGKSRKEIKYARGLWASGMIEIHNSAAAMEEGDLDENDMDDFVPHSRVFVAKAPICAVAGRFQELLPHKRSWPILELEDLVGNHPFNAWTDIDAILMFVYRGEFHAGTNSYYDSTEGDIVNWRLGMDLQYPKLQNATMKAIMKRDSETQTTLDLMGGKIPFVTNPVADCICMMEKLGVVHKADGKFQTHKLMSYMIDRLTWDAMNGGFTYLKVVHRGGCVANMVARAQVDAAKKPKPAFAPWHIFNRHKYLMSEDLETSKVGSIGGNDRGKSTKRKRTS